MKHEMLRSIVPVMTWLSVFVGMVSLMAIYVLQPFMAETLPFKGVIFTDGLSASTLLTIGLLAVVCMGIAAATASMVASAIGGGPNLGIGN